MVIYRPEYPMLRVPLPPPKRTSRSHNCHAPRIRLWNISFLTDNIRSICASFRLSQITADLCLSLLCSFFSSKCLGFFSFQPFDFTLFALFFGEFFVWICGTRFAPYSFADFLSSSEIFVGSFVTCEGIIGGMEVAG